MWKLALCSAMYSSNLHTPYALSASSVEPLIGIWLSNSSATITSFAFLRRVVRELDFPMRQQPHDSCTASSATYSDTFGLELVLGITFTFFAASLACLLRLNASIVSADNLRICICVQVVEYPLQQSRFLPLHELLVDYLQWSVLRWQVFSATRNAQNTIQDLSGFLAWPAFASYCPLRKYVCSNPHRVSLSS